MPESKKFIVSHPEIAEPIQVGRTPFAARNRVVGLLSPDNTRLIFPDDRGVTRLVCGPGTVISYNGTFSPHGGWQNY